MISISFAVMVVSKQQQEEIRRTHQIHAVSCCLDGPDVTRTTLRTGSYNVLHFSCTIFCSLKRNAGNVPRFYAG